MNTLIFKVNGENINWVSGYEPTSGEKKYSKLRFEFNEEWKYVDSVTVFQYFDISKVVTIGGIEIQDGVAVANISKELRNQSGILHIGVMGVRTDDPEVTLSSHIVFVPIGKGVCLNGTESTKLVQDLLEYIARLEGRLIDKDNPVTSELLGLGAVENKHLSADLKVNQNMIEDGSISAAKLALLSVMTKHIKNGAITEPKIATGAVNTNHLAKGAVTNEKLASDSVTSNIIANGAVGSSQLADRAINRPELFDPFFLETYLSMPVKTIEINGVIQDNSYDNVVDTGIYNVSSFFGERETLVVYRQSDARVVQVRYLTDKIFFRGIHATKGKEFSADEWGEWINITEKPTIEKGAVGSDELADKSVTAFKIADAAVDDNHLLSSYFKTNDIISILRKRMLHNNLKNWSDEMSKPYQNIYRFLNPAEDGLGYIGVGRCLGVFSDSNTFIVHNLETNKRCKVSFTENDITSVEEMMFDSDKMPAADTLKLISSLGEDADPELIAYQTSDPTTPSTIRIPLSLIKGLLGMTGTQDFVNAGEFDTLDKIYKYHFQYDKIYRVDITEDIYCKNNIRLPKGVYICRYYCYVNGGIDIDYLELAPLVANGTSYRLDVYGGDCSILYTADQTFDPESENAQSGIAVAKAKDFINLGEFHDIKRLDWALGKNGYDTSKVYRFSFIDDISIDDYVIPGGTAYIGHVTNSEKRGFAMEFEPIISDGVKRIIILGTEIPNVYDYLELASFISDGTGADSSDPNRHAEYFTISDDGELSLKPEYTAIGELNAELPADLVIPEVVNEIAVDRLVGKMFLENKVIESVTFPDTINDIPDECFNMAVNLRYINNTEHIKKIGVKGFRYTRIEKAVFPSLEELAEDENGLSLAFSTVPHLAYADVGKVTDIPAKTFKHCSSLSKIVGDNITEVKAEAFCDTPRLTNAGFVSNLKSIGDFAFWQTKFKFDWKSLSNCNFSEKSTTAQIYPEDFWSDIDFTTCENPTPTALGQRDPRWSDVQYGVDENPSGHIQTYYVGCLQMSIMHAYAGLTGRKFETVFEFENIIKALTKANEKVVIFKRNGNSVEFDNYLVAQNGSMAHAIPMAEAAGLATTYYEKSNWNSDRLRAIYETLANGGYVVLNIDEPAEHAILIYGVSDKGELLVLDSTLHFPYDESIPSRYKLPFNTLVYPTSDMVTLTLSNISASIYEVDKTTTAGKIIFYYKSEVPENVEFVKVGILGVDKSNYNEATFHVGTTDGNVYDRNPPSDGTGKPNTPYSWTKSNVAAGQTWVAKAYVQYRTLYGSIVTIYSDTIEITRES